MAQAAPAPAPAFVEAKVVADPAPAAEGAGAIEVCLRGGRRLRVGSGGFDARVLSELVTVLEGLS